MSILENMKEICIQQGYVPSECKLNGTLIYLLIKEGKNPCSGCNMQCPYARPNRNYFELYEKEIKELRQKELKESNEKRKRIRERFSKKAPAKVIMNIDCEYKEVNAYVMNLESERMYYARFSDLSYASNMIPLICKKYNVEQILIEINGCGLGLYDMLKNHVEIDIVPMFCTRIEL